MISAAAIPDFLGQMGLLTCVLKTQLPVLLLLSFSLWLLYSAFSVRHTEGKSHLSSLVLPILSCFMPLLCNDVETNRLPAVVYLQIVVCKGRVRKGCTRQPLKEPGCILNTALMWAYTSAKLGVGAALHIHGIFYVAPTRPWVVWKALI